MALLAYQQVGITGLNPTYANAGASGDQVVPNPNGFLHVKNGSGASINVTVVVPGTEYGQNRADVVVAVSAAGAKMIGPFPTDLQDASTGQISVTYSSATSVTVAAVRV